MNKIIAATFFFVTLLFLGFIFLFNNSKTETDNNQVLGIVEENNKQIIEITAKGGYSPRVVEAKANKETILKIKTNNTFDCSSSLVISDLNVRKNLPSTGMTEFNIPSQKSGTELVGNCSMGMYGFKIKFN